MALKDTTKNLRDLLARVTSDLEKADGGNKAASQRVRTGTVKLEKLAKQYRKESIQGEKGKSKAPRKAASSKKAAPKKAAAPASKKAAAPKAKKKAAAPAARPAAAKRPTAKLFRRAAR